MSPCDEAVNYGPYESPSFQVAKPSKITAISAIIMIYIYIEVSLRFFIFIQHKYSPHYDTGILQSE
jgi:hypothetical protein